MITFEERAEGKATVTRSESRGEGRPADVGESCVAEVIADAVAIFRLGSERELGADCVEGFAVRGDDEMGDMEEL